MGGMGLLVHVHLDVSVVTGPCTLRGFILMSLWSRYSEMIRQFMFMSLLSRYIEEHIQKTGVAIETQGFTFITSGRKRESLTVRSVYYYYTSVTSTVVTTVDVHLKCHCRTHCNHLYNQYCYTLL